MRVRLTGLLRHGMRKLGFVLILSVAAAAAYSTYPDRSPAFAEPPQAAETPGLFHGTTPPPDEVNVQSLEAAPPVEETTPPQKIRPHTRDPEKLKLMKQLLEEGLIKPKTDVIEDTADHPSSATKKEGNP